MVFKNVFRIIFLWWYMNYTKVFKNAKWIIVCKIIQSVLQLIVGMLSARYLGPSNYGLISYATSITAFAIPFMKLGFDSYLVHSLVESPEKEGEIMGTSLVMNVVSGFFCIGGVVGFAFFANAGEKETVLVCLIYSLSLIFGALEMIQYWFQYKLKSKYSSLVMLASYFIVCIYKILLLIFSKSVYWFAVVHSLEYGLVALGLILIYFKSGGRLSFSFSTGKALFSRSKHYILASLMIVVIQNTDHIMITEIVGKSENGLYSAAITCTVVVQFVYYAIIDSFRPVILENKKNNSEEYKTNISQLYGLIFYMSLAQCIVFFALAKLIVSILYGAEYMGTVPILRILVWYFIFSVMGSVRNVWILAEQKQKYLWRINITGAVLNIILNAILIPNYGACGAAFASFLTQFIMNFILGFIFKPICENNRLLMQGINPGFMIKQGKNLIKVLKKN